MSTKTKRTYNLPLETVGHVKDLVAHGGFAASQDGIVEVAIERLYRDVREKEEAALWARASNDPEFQAEMEELAAEFRDAQGWAGD